MSSLWLTRLLPLFERESSRGDPLVLATVIRTAGPTYTKAGAQMLITRSGEYAGLLSGGCLEGDLSERASRVFDTGEARVARYDMTGPDDLLFGLGSGCEGAMDILLQRLDAAGGWQPLHGLAAAWRERRRQRLLLVVGAQEAGTSLPAGAGMFLDERGGGTVSFGAIAPEGLTVLRRIAAELGPASGTRLLSNAAPGPEVLVLEQLPAPRLLLLGAGTDAQSLARLLAFLGWSFTVVDHRPHYARAERFPEATGVFEGGAESAEQLLRQQRADPFSAAVVMSHHLRTDLTYLRVLAVSDVPYIGLLGPVSRRDRLLEELGELASRLEGRLHAPVGVDLGPGSPEAIALSIAAEIHACIAGGSLRPLGTGPLCGMRRATPA
jgi:xanthine/CO dehydrogenase XdhC/CoxF family maturation factor